MVSVFLWPQWGQVRVAVRMVMQGILSAGPYGNHSIRYSTSTQLQTQRFDERRECRW